LRSPLRTPPPVTAAAAAVVAMTMAPGRAVSKTDGEFSADEKDLKKNMYPILYYDT